MGKSSRKKVSYSNAIARFKGAWIIQLDPRLPVKEFFKKKFDGLNKGSKRQLSFIAHCQLYGKTTFIAQKHGVCRVEAWNGTARKPVITASK